MSSLTLLIIRHGEKPPKKPKDFDYGAGVDAKGAPDPKSLAVRGWQRAGAWTALFGSGAFGPDYPKPDVIYAANPNQQGGNDDSISRRPLETIQPLADRLHLFPNVDYGVGQEQALVDELVTLTGTALIAWEHKMIGQQILPLLADGQRLANLPAKWDGDRFDVVLRFDRAQEGAAWRFQQLFPRLLVGDSDTPLGLRNGSD
jgi:hypothetical protein